MITGALGILAVGVCCLAFGLALFAPRTGLPFTCALLVLSFLFRIVTTYRRFQIEVVNDQYTNTPSDTHRYLLYGRDRWMQDVPVMRGVTPAEGTDSMFAFTQVFYEVFGDHTFLVFVAGAALGLIGQWLIAAALLEIRPDVPRILVLLVALFPTTVYWTSSMGKDSVTILALGLVLYTLARGVTRRVVPLGWSVATAGALAVLVCIRVEVAVAMIAGLLVAWCAVSGRQDPRLAPTDTTAGRPDPASRGAGPGTVGAGPGRIARFRTGWLVLTFGVVPVAFLVAVALGFEDPWGIIAEYSGSYERTSTGGSDVQSSRPEGLAGLAIGAFTAIFRPFPWEGGIEGLVSSLDTIPILLALVLVVRAVLVPSTWSEGRARVVVCALLICVAIFAQLTQFGNLGLLARLRSLIVPVLVLVVAVLPTVDRMRGAVRPGGLPRVSPRRAATVTDVRRRASGGRTPR